MRVKRCLCFSGEKCGVVKVIRVFKQIFFNFLKRTTLLDLRLVSSIFLEKTPLSVFFTLFNPVMGFLGAVQSLSGSIEVNLNFLWSYLEGRPSFWTVCF